MPRFHLPLVEPGGRFSRTRLSEQDSSLRPREVARTTLQEIEPEVVTQVRFRVGCSGPRRGKSHCIPLSRKRSTPAMGKVRPHQARLAGKKKLEETSCICFFETLQTLTARLALNQDLRNRNGFISAFGDLVFLKKCKGYK